MDVVLVTPEIAPYTHTTPAAGPVAALAKALRGLEHKVTVISPLWAAIDPSARHLGRRLTKIEVPMPEGPVQLALYEGRTAGGVDLVFLASEVHFAAGHVASDDSDHAGLRWALFLRGVMEVLRRRDARPDVVHAHEWQTAPLSLMMREDKELATIPTVLSISAIDTAGRYDKSLLAAFALPPRVFSIEGVEFFGKFSALKAGLVAAHRIVTPGPSFLRAFLEAGGGGGLEGVLRTREGALSGIVPGVDAALYNPATDPHLVTRFDAMDVSGAGSLGKMRCKEAMQQELGLPVRDDVPLAVTLGTSGPRSGLDRLAEVLPTLAKNDAQIAIMVEDEGSTATARIAEHAARFPDRIALRTGADTALVHRALGAADLVIVPDVEDPRAHRQLEAHRYGAVPIGRRIGLFADTVVDCDAQLRSGDGFMFDEPTNDALVGAVQRAFAGFTQRAAFRNVQVRAISADHGWERPARLFERVYRQAAPKVEAAEATA
jgi:starch synthase